VRAACVGGTICCNDSVRVACVRADRLRSLGEVKLGLRDW
jgi:hypothetical protein